jgi:hypothetical protein
MAVMACCMAATCIFNHHTCDYFLSVENKKKANPL